MSTDRPDTQKKFHRALRAQYSLIADTKGELTRLFNVRMSRLPLARRRTFVISTDKQIIYVGADQDAVDPSGAIEAVASLRDSRMPRW